MKRNWRTSLSKPWTVYIGLFGKIPECLFPMQHAIYILSKFLASSNEENMFG